MYRIARTILAASDERVQRAASDYAAKVRTVTDSDLDSRTKKLINKYAQELIVDKKTPVKQIIRENGPDLIEYLSSRDDVSYDDIPAILNYFASLQLKTVASTQPACEESIDSIRGWE